MAKSKARQEEVVTESKPRRDRAAEAEAQLRGYHALGRKALALVKDGRTDPEGRRKLGEQSGHCTDDIRKAQVFASSYTAEQLDELCKLRTPKGMPLPWRHLRRLLMVPPGETRDTLQREATEGGWSMEELVAAIPDEVRQKQTSRGGGRAFHEPRTLADRLRQIEQYSEEWLRRFGSKDWVGEEWLDGEAGAAGPDGSKARLTSAQEALRKVRELVVELESKLTRIGSGEIGEQPGGSKATETGKLKVSHKAPAKKIRQR